MFDQLFSAFSSSNQGQQAMAQLTQQGYSPQQAQGILAAALPAAATAMQQGLAGGGPQQPGIVSQLTSVGDSNYMMNFVSAAMSSMIRGQGLKGAAVDGLQGVVGGHVAQVIATRFGLPQRVAGVAGAVITPMLIDWLYDKYQNGGLQGLLGQTAQPGYAQPAQGYAQPQQGYAQQGYYQQPMQPQYSSTGAPIPPPYGGWPGQR